MSSCAFLTTFIYNVIHFLNVCISILDQRFMRHKVALKDRFLQHREGVLKLGKDVSMVSMASSLLA